MIVTLETSEDALEGVWKKCSKAMFRLMEPGTHYRNPFSGTYFQCRSRFI
ncbi:hypothetical protein HMPREF9997_01214 [Corynebacterium durum F0235]|uniref:Uncharacterized protein n=1 Tax=Corynebacterium durum F0235 TaxID=1035195 RepID=L1MHF8_9CORY|nr:hypothetical protein HMPREF9997_01214 [Corynebacterium durum F0235]